MDYLCCLHQLPAGWSRRMLWSELARINDREGFVSFFLSKRIVVLWTMTLKAAENFCLYECASDALIYMILSDWWMLEGSPGEGMESLTILLWQQRTISAILYWNYSWCLSSSPPWRVGSVAECDVQELPWKKILCLSPFLLRIKTPIFFFSFSKHRLFADQETISPFIFVFPSHLHMF